MQSQHIKEFMRSLPCVFKLTVGGTGRLTLSVLQVQKFSSRTDGRTCMKLNIARAYKYPYANLNFYGSKKCRFLRYTHFTWTLWLPPYRLTLLHMRYAHLSRNTRQVNLAMKFSVMSQRSPQQDTNRGYGLRTWTVSLNVPNRPSSQPTGGSPLPWETDDRMVAPDLQNGSLTLCYQRRSHAVNTAVETGNILTTLSLCFN
jgi:hypothetical protein